MRYGSRSADLHVILAWFIELYNNLLTCNGVIQILNPPHAPLSIYKYIDNTHSSFMHTKLAKTLASTWRKRTRSERHAANCTHGPQTRDHLNIWEWLSQSPQVAYNASKLLSPCGLLSYPPRVDTSNETSHREGWVPQRSGRRDPHTSPQTTTQRDGLQWFQVLFLRSLTRRLGNTITPYLLRGGRGPLLYTQKSYIKM